MNLNHFHLSNIHFDRVKLILLLKTFDIPLKLNEIQSIFNMSKSLKYIFAFQVCTVTPIQIIFFDVGLSCNTMCSFSLSPFFTFSCQIGEAT